MVYALQGVFAFKLALAPTDTNRKGATMNRSHPLVQKYRDPAKDNQRDSAWVAQRLGITRVQLNRLVSAGQICPITRGPGGRSLQFDLAEVDRYLASLENEQSV